MASELLDSIDAAMVEQLSLPNLFKLRSEATPDTVTTFYGEIDWASMTRVLKIMAVGTSSRVLDVGCGGGRWLVAANESKCAGVFGIEYVADRAQVARNVLGERATVITGDACDVALWNDIRPTHVIMYDKIWCDSALDPLNAIIQASPTVMCVASWKMKHIPGFEVASNLFTHTWPTNERFRCYIHKRVRP